MFSPNTCPAPAAAGASKAAAKLATASADAQAALPPSPEASVESRLDARLQAHIWRASSLGASQLASPASAVSSGFAALDAELPGGGWPIQGLSEILCDSAATLEWRLLAPALRLLLAEPTVTGSSPASAAQAKRRSKPRVPMPGSRAGRSPAARHASHPLLLINPPLAPHLPGLQRYHLPAQRLIWLAPETPAQQLWALEQAIKANATAAILAWLPQVRPEQIRRLQSCAQAMQAPIFLFRPLAVAAQSSAAPLRVGLSPGPDWKLQLSILKRRGPLHEGVLHLPAMPADLGRVLTPRMLNLAQQSRPAAQRPTAIPVPATAPMRSTAEARHALARPALPARSPG
ncbi:recombinase RecA [Paucibacter sp. AS339]|uniref:recombinase RecA n=1 Tax=Paucibacter hankyongi TaxID=3133434 RepID=UPI00309D7CCD